MREKKQKYRDLRISALNSSYHALSIKVLKREGRAMSAEEIFQKISRIKTFRGKTPDATLRSVLFRSPFIENTGRGSYRLIKIPLELR